MRMPRRKSLALAAVVGATLTLMTPSAAFAYYGDELNYAVASSGPTGDYTCTTVSGATACFKPNGDDFFVKDTKADGHAAAADWLYSNYARTGACVNTLGSGTWGVCNKDFTEGQQIRLAASVYEQGRYVVAGSLISVYA